MHGGIAKSINMMYNKIIPILTTFRSRGDNMKILLNEDKELVAQIKEGLKRKGGYCPCRLQKEEEYKCMCEEFKQQIADPDFEGYCHCMLYYKKKD